LHKVEKSDIIDKRVKKAIGAARRLGNSLTFKALALSENGGNGIEIRVQ
jgi:hypothetical protein